MSRTSQWSEWRRADAVRSIEGPGPPPPPTFFVGRKTMSPTRIFTAIVICLAGLLSGTVVGFILGGLGICAMDLTPGLVGFCALLGAGLSASVGLLWRRAWWAGALAFSVPALLGVAAGVSSREWQRVIGTGACIMASGFAALIVRFPRPRSLKE